LPLRAKNNLSDVSLIERFLSIYHEKQHAVNSVLPLFLSFIQITML
jgi:hypothetical protein